MAFIDYHDVESVPQALRVPDTDNIIQVHSVHPKVMKLHYELYLELMHSDSPLNRIEREMVAILVSSINDCHY